MTLKVFCFPAFMIMLVVLLQPVTALTQSERILNYDTRIEVHPDRSITVSENIQVQVTGQVIKRGITRYLPGKRSLNHRTVRMKYDIQEVQKNDQKEPYRTESANGGMMMYLGSKDVLLSPGVYTYKIKYRVTDQIGFFDDYDEIYWNAIGNEVRFMVDNASCQVILPPGANLVQQAAYLGYGGERDSSYEFSQQNNTLEYRATRPLNPGEGFTVAVGFDKGHMESPGLFDRKGSLILILLASLFLIPYYIYTWMLYGIDPPTPASYPLWNSPDGLSAGSINYIKNGHYQNKSFTASVIDLAIKGFLRIEESESKTFFISRKIFTLIKMKEMTEDMPQEEKYLFNRLFQSRNEVEIDGKYDPTIEGAFSKHKSSLNAQHSAFIWKGHNAKFLVVPILVTLSVIILGIVLYANGAYADNINFTALLAFVPLSIISLILYAYLIRKPTMKKLELRSRIRGFQMYLEMAEKDRLRLLNPPDMTPEHFEAILPYAFALGVEHTWSEKFKTILDQMQYQPKWHNSANAIYFSTHFGNSFERSVSGAATKPSSSGSGSGGGGFSGGGGGGGGVGGW